MGEDFNWPPDSRISVLSLESGAHQDLDALAPRVWPDVAAARPDRRRPWWLFAAALTILIVSVSAGVWWFGRGGIAIPTAPASFVAHPPPPPVPPTAVTLNPPPNIVPAPGTDRPIRVTRIARTTAPPNKTRAIVSPVRERANTSVNPPVDDARRRLDVAQLPPAEIDVVAAAATEDPLRIYSGADPGVTAPVLLSRGFVAPRATGIGLSSTSRIELVVSDTGAVEHVKLLAPSRTMKDAILLSRAKQFEFTPATRDAIRVRYRVVLQIEEGP